MNMIKKSIRTLIPARLGTLTQWPLIARHIGERRLRAQLQLLGWSVGRLLRFGATAFALRKSWQARYAPWREVREEVTILGPDMNSSLTSTVDIIIPETQQPDVEEQVLYLPERADDRQRCKAAQPAISMFHIEGEERIVARCPEMFEPVDAYHPGDSQATAGQLNLLLQRMIALQRSSIALHRSSTTMRRSGSSHAQRPQEVEVQLP